MSATQIINNPVGSANIATNQVSVGTSATLLAAARPGTPTVGRIAATIYNGGSSTIFVGGASVTTANGVPVPAGAAITINTTAALYAIAASGTDTVGIVETY